ncbi:hypothetical protein CHARACLAT_032642 [Characodon lateralis]|uniref:Integrase core domain-containing protein n=1 Tax=Characodon lateralis TaxID=208331 RepID=A0ABU7DXN3_9TELE|nr:hypothetical protein [Characodon lateralis]
METLAAYSAVIDLNINEVDIVNLRSVLERVDAVEPQMGRGRPTINIPFESIEIYLSNGFKVQKIAELFGVGHQTLCRRMQSNGLRMSDMYSAMSDQELDACKLEICCSWWNRWLQPFVYLSAATNNRASTVLESFIGSINKFGFPSHVRADKGGENMEVSVFMVEHIGENRNSHITGRSVHNQR